jgi:hypothetical protein
LSIFIPPNVKVIVEGDSGEVRHVQSLADFLQKPSLQVQIATYGKTLLDILVEESYISENLVLRQVLTGNPHADATRLIGSIAESLVVDYCSKDTYVNQTLAMYARSGLRQTQNLNDYVAVATGSMRTKRNYGQHYNPSDTQRDIIWVEKNNTENQLLCISKKNNVSAKPAGLQVKASHDGVNYVLPTIEAYHYPILYFDLNDDWGVVNKAVMQNFPGSILIHPDEIQREIKNILRGFFDIVLSIINGTITVHELIKELTYEGLSVFKSGVDAAKVTTDEKIILPSRIN